MSFKSNTDSTSYLELPNTENVSFSKGYVRLVLAILMVRFYNLLLPFCLVSLSY